MSDHTDNFLEAEAKPMVSNDPQRRLLQLSEFAKSQLKELTAEGNEFWKQQPVTQFSDIFENKKEGRIMDPIPVSQLRKEPYFITDAYEWTNCDMNSDDMCNEVYLLLSSNYVQHKNYQLYYSKESLRWALCPSGFHLNWHLGIRDKDSNSLIGFISAIPARVSLRGEVVDMAKINFLCVKDKFRGARLACFLITELTRRIQHTNVWQAFYTVTADIPTAFTTIRYWHRLLKTSKLVGAGFSTVPSNSNPQRREKELKLKSTAPTTPGFRRMELRDVPIVTDLLRRYFENFLVAPVFNCEDVAYWILPKENVVNSYVVESPETKEITDFCSFYSLEYRQIHNLKKFVKVANSHYNVATKTPWSQLMGDALIVAKSLDFDVFNAMDLMENEKFLEELKFRRGDGQLNYHLYNYHLNGLKASDVAVFTI